jgi:xanthine dehydrogenase accessory factor
MTVADMLLLDGTPAVRPRRTEPPTSAIHCPPGDLPELLELLAQGHSEHLRGALVTLVAVEGGARAPGAQMAVIEDGRFAGYIAGGCLESIIASEAVRLIGEDRDDLLRFGVGSPFVDVRLPCGGSIDVHVHVKPDAALLTAARSRLANRQCFAIDYVPECGTAELLESPAEELLTGWHELRFRRVYLPQTRLLLIGHGLELEVLARLGAASGHEVVALTADDSAERIARSGDVVARPLGARAPDDLPVDPWTAVVLLFHEHDRELPLLRAALRAQPFYIGALGSSRAHRERCERLLTDGVSLADVDRIRGPIGLFGPTRDAVSLSLSVLAELAQFQMKVGGL